MTRYVVLLRAVNVGGTGKVPMPRLRELLAEAGLEDVATYVQSGNVVVSPGRVTGGAEAVGAAVHDAIRDGFGLSVPVVVRTGAQIAKVLAANPFPDADPTRVGVLFASGPIPKAEIERLAGRAKASEDVQEGRGPRLHQLPRRLRAQQARDGRRGAPERPGGDGAQPPHRGQAGGDGDGRPLTDPGRVG